MLTAFILTKNEKIHLERCIESLLPISEEIFIIDSGSTDTTLEIAERMGAKIFQNPWPGSHAKQINWALENCPFKSPWIMRLDADEYLSSGIQQEILEKLPLLGEEISGIELPRKVVFQGHWIKNGGFYPINLLRIWRRGKGKSEDRMMDEHIILSEGKITQFKEDIIDENLNNHAWWKEKHLNYAKQEAKDYFLDKNRQEGKNLKEGEAVEQAIKKRKLKVNYYNRLPLFFRVMVYFIFRFILQKGFLDHPIVWKFHFKQGFWYRWQVDYEILKLYFSKKSKK